MATFGRSFKPPAYFSRARRPAAPGRTMSNSSDVSVASNRSEDHDHFIMSGLNTPAQEKTGSDGFKVAQPEMRSPRAVTFHFTKIQRTASTALTPSRKAVSLATTQYLSPSWHPKPSAAQVDHARANTPVASYLPSGAHHTSLPMGKYYPSNYENRPLEPRIGPSAPPVRVSSTRSEGHIPSRETFRSSNKDTEVRRKLAQYQRDMIAQARLAASEVLGSSAESSAASTVLLNGVPLPTLHIGGPGSHKPLSPRLLPLGSPGPVTPMNLEGEDVGGYLDSGRNDEIARVLRAEEERIRREGATSPAVETGPQAF
ncbi:hypothetical protein C8035_v007237 [Colletotrichum spinosum]|uniref:Uncharacterized protein n=1 Tax=Colletotrichum spinosum TaxID=1347390 RepID=A0A4R8QHJ9_9PEZI|nr:hypothetical protein C8035_v007237 [Colletotrichum spinosum]